MADSGEDPGAELPPHLATKYSAIIDGILGVSDLQTVSVKKIRTGLQGAVDEDLSERKKVINELIRTRFDKFAQQANVVAEPPASSPPMNGASPFRNGTAGRSHAAHSTSASVTPPAKARTPSEELSDVIDEPRPKKKVKRSASEEDDAAFAARLQAEENTRSRPTRGGGPKKRAPVKKKVVKKKNKSATKVNSDDDSVDGSGSDDSKPVKRNGAFHKPFNLSPALQELLGETQLSRPQTVKKIWAYVKERDLQKPTDKRQIMCDEPMRAVFKADSVHMFTMNKILNTQLYPVDE